MVQAKCVHVVGTINCVLFFYSPRRVPTFCVIPLKNRGPPDLPLALCNFTYDFCGIGGDFTDMCAEKCRLGGKPNSTLNKVWVT